MPRGGLSRIEADVVDQASARSELRMDDGEFANDWFFRASYENLRVNEENGVLRHIAAKLRVTLEIMWGIVKRSVMELRSWASVIRPWLFPKRQPVEVVDIDMAPQAIREAEKTPDMPMLFVTGSYGVPAAEDYQDIAVLMDLAARKTNTKMVLAIVEDDRGAVDAFKTALAQYLAHTVMKRIPSNVEIMGFGNEGHFIGAFPGLLSRFNENIRPGSHSLAALITDGKLRGVERVFGSRQDFLKVIAKTSREQATAVIASAAELLKEATVRGLMSRSGFAPARELLSEFSELLNGLEAWSRAVTAMARAA